MKRVYIAGPISKGNMLRNCIRGMKVAHQVLKLGYIPFCPHQSWIWQQVTPLTHNEWLEYDFRWIELCDAVLRISGKSIGADLEERFAKEHGIPVYYSIRELKKKCRLPGKKGGKK
jgi:hypothetical protein